MGKIKILSQSVVSKIAAGEVVQRPSNVVKELVENSIDANSTLIRIIVENGGLNKIEVQDNGHGMPPEDVLKAYLPHSTSKLHEESDLDGIRSLGFRGEALDSISSISTLTLKSRTENSIEGFLVVIRGGELIEQSAIGMPKGTTVLVEDLFFNTPARKKFLKSTQTEFSQITHVVANLALANPNVGFELIHNKKEIFKLLPENNLNNRMETLLGETLLSNFVSVNYVDPHLKLTGFVSKPQYSSKGKNKRYLFVNKRAVSAGVLSSIIRKSYGNLLEASAGPAFILYLNFSPDLVDVNVDPRKETVRFVNQKFISDCVDVAINEALQRHDLTYINQGYIATNEFVVKDTELPAYFTDALDSKIMQIHGLYLIKETQSGIMILDQHAAHERILYEKFLETFTNERKSENSFDLQSPFVFDLPVAEAYILKENINIFSDLGFVIEEFGQNTFKVICVPHILRDRNITALIEEVLEDLENDEAPKDIDHKTKRALSYLACRSAIKAGDYLTPQERAVLFNELENTKTNYTCPHGRPTKVEIKTKDLEKLFKR